MPREVCKLALTHVNSHSAEDAYRQGDLLELRRMLMADWAAYIAGSIGIAALHRGAFGPEAHV